MNITQKLFVFMFILFFPIILNARSKEPYNQDCFPESKPKFEIITTQEMLNSETSSKNASYFTADEKAIENQHLEYSDD